MFSLCTFLESYLLNEAFRSSHGICFEIHTLCGVARFTIIVYFITYTGHNKNCSKIAVDDPISQGCRAFCTGCKQGRLGLFTRLPVGKRGFPDICLANSVIDKPGWEKLHHLLAVESHTPAPLHDTNS